MVYEVLTLYIKDGMLRTYLSLGETGGSVVDLSMSQFSMFPRV